MTRDRGPVLKLALILTALLVQPSPAVAETPNFGTSLDWVPADAAFYASSMRIKATLGKSYRIQSSARWLACTCRCSPLRE
jgi:hypothetical protein